MVNVVQPANFPAPIAPYSPGISAGKNERAVYTSGILALGDDGSVLHADDAAAQTRYVLERISDILAAAGATLRDVAFNHVFLTDWEDYAAINAVYAEFFPESAPARYCVQVGLVKPGLRVEIASVAHVAEC